MVGSIIATALAAFPFYGYQTRFLGLGVAVRGVFGVELADEFLIGAVARGLEIGGGQDGAGLLHVRCPGGHGGVSGEKHMSDIAGFEEQILFICEFVIYLFI